MRLKTFLYAIVFLSSFQNGISQSEVRGFSYLAYAKTNSDGAYVGVGFFLKLKKNLYFITAKHVAAIPCDTLTILICDSCIEPNRTLKIDISAAPKSANPIFGDTDIYIQKIDSKLQRRINSVDKFLAKDYHSFNFKKIESIFIYGFPDTTNNFPFNLETSFPNKIMTKASLIGSYDLVRYSQTLNKYDSINYWGKAIDNTYASEGDSGAPVFFKIGDKYYFGGMCVSGVHSLNVISIVRPEKLIEFLLGIGNKKKES